MHSILKNPRHGCELHGALKTLEEISGTVPIVHANAGCVYQHYNFDRAGVLAAGGISGPEIPATEVIEKQIVFGGASRLREEIKNAAKVIEGRLYVILGSCEAAMVGDDLAAMAKEARDISLPALCYPATGFRGGSHNGYANVLQSVLQQLPEIKKLNTEKTKGLVNILGILPKTDVFYKGDLEEIRRLVEAAGLKANIFFGTPDGVGDLERSVQAGHTLVFSHWGIAPAEQLKSKYGIPYTVFDSLPLGIDEAKEFFAALSAIPGADREKAKAFIENEEQQYQFYFRSISTVFFLEALARNVVLAGDTSSVNRIGKFLEKKLGASVKAAILTDRYGKDENKPPLPEGLGEKIIESSDSGEIEEIIRGSGAEFILGSAWETRIAKALGIQSLVISAPNSDRLLLHKTYAGIRGAYFLAEDYISAILQHKTEKEAEQRRLLESLSVSL
ncbi:nitrogenase component 1 [Leadbettera azotonutricia]|uniref:NifK1 n=1 Tax=Leadbettera azotonutricia (strain ATCC BAA-888 / DSM 13862 / ZAS-9) TaxID=545695 RepID=F5YCN4_LEAAZ|nr:nitrogenase component 1 [Leadbettera azotonutricia]AEF81169.1 NifK1 [Leadbettera azotonutricia ZAS-9]